MEFGQTTTLGKLDPGTMFRVDGLDATRYTGTLLATSDCSAYVQWHRQRTNSFVTAAGEEVAITAVGVREHISNGTPVLPALIGGDK